MASSRDVAEQTLIVQVRAYVRQHLSDPDLRIDRYWAFKDATHFTRRFRSAFGGT